MSHHPLQRSCHWASVHLAGSHAPDSTAPSMHCQSELRLGPHELKYIHAVESNIYKHQCIEGQQFNTNVSFKKYELNPEEPVTIFVFLFSGCQVPVRGGSAQNNRVAQHFYTCCFWGTVIWSRLKSENLQIDGWDKIILLIDRHADNAERRSPPSSLCDCVIVWCLHMNTLRGDAEPQKTWRWPVSVEEFGCFWWFCKQEH